MKKIVASQVVLIALVLFAALSCKKETTNPFSDVANFAKGAYLTLDTTLSTNLNYSQLSSSQVGVKVSQYPGGQEIDRIRIYAVQGSTYDTTKWKFVKSVPYSGKGTSLTVTGAELASALGVSLNSLPPGSNYTFYNRVISKSGAAFDVNNTSNNNGSGFITGPTYNGAFFFNAYIVCPFTAPVGGTYKVVRDDWADWNTGDLVQVMDGPAGSNTIDLSAVWPNPAYGNLVNHLIVKIDPATGSASVPKVNFGDYGGGYNMTAQGSNAGDNAGFVFACTGYIKLTMNLKANGAGGNGYDNGPTTLILQKQ